MRLTVGNRVIKDVDWAEIRNGVVKYYCSDRTSSQTIESHPDGITVRHDIGSTVHTFNLDRGVAIILEDD